MQVIGRLLFEGDRKNLKVFLYRGMSHGKIILVDRERAFIGSANLMKSSLDDMGEVNVLLDGSRNGAVKKLRDVLRNDVLRSRPFTRLPAFSWIWRWLTWVKL